MPLQPHPHPPLQDDMPCSAYVGHRLAHRTRLKIPSRRGDEAYFNQVKAALEQQAVISSAEVNPHTASILIHHQTTLEEIGLFAEKTGLFALSLEAPELASLTPSLMDAARAADGFLREVTGGRLNGSEAGLLALLIMGLYQLWKGETLAPAATLLWYAAGLLMTGTLQPGRTALPVS